MCDVRLRENCSKYYWTTKFVRINNRWMKATNSKNYGKLPIKIKVDLLNVDDNTEGKFYFDANKYYKMYDTDELLKVQEMKDEKKK